MQNRHSSNPPEQNCEHAEISTPVIPEETREHAEKATTANPGAKTKHRSKYRHPFPAQKTGVLVKEPDPQHR